MKNVEKTSFTGHGTSQKCILKNTEKMQVNEYRVLRKGRLRKWLSGFLAVSTAVTMLGGQISSFYGGESDSAYALAGEGSGEDITIHFGDGEDKAFSIHVNPETNEEEATALAGLGSEAEEETDLLAGLDSETEAETEAETDNTGLEKVEVGDFVTISSVDGSLLPEEAEASAEILSGRAENTAVEKVEEVASEEPASETAVPAESIAQNRKDEEAEGEEIVPEAESAMEAVEKTEYQVFDISLDNVDEEQYQEGFKVEVSLPEDVKGKDFKLYHIHEGEDPVEIPVETVGTIDPETGLEVVSGFEFKTDGFSEFVLQYTVDFHYELNGKTVEFSIPGGGFVSLEHVVEALGIASVDENTENGDNSEGEVPGAEESGENGTTCEDAIKLNEVEVSEATKKFVADVESVEFSSPELVWVGKVNEAVTVGRLKEVNGLEVEYSSDLTEERIAEINAQTVETGDWALISLKPFDTEESLTVTMKGGEVFTIRVTDAQISTHVITADGEDFLITVTYGPEAGIPDGAELTARELLPGTEEYKAHYAQMIDAVEGEASDSDPDNEMNAEFAEVGLEVVDPQSRVDVAFARFFDISIWKDEVEIEPLVPVQVEIQYIDPVCVDSDAEAEIIHFADDGIELIDPETDLNESSGEGISSFTYQQSSFSISATLLKYTTGIPNGNYVIIKGAKVNNQDRYFALKADGSTVEVTKNGDTFTNNSNNANDAFWTFTSAGNGQYYIQNRSNGYNRLVLYNNIVGGWDQRINVEVPDGRKTVYLRNPNNTPLRFNGNTCKFVLGSQNDNADQFYLARMTSEVPQGRGYNLTPAGETDLGDLNAWKNKVENSKIIVDKTANVVDYDNRIYQIDLKALSDITIIANKVDLELIVDTSRSMYFPANLSPLPNNYFTSIMGNDNHSLESQLSRLDRNQIYYFIGNGEQATVYALYYAASGTNLNDYTGDQCWKFIDASYMNPPDASAMNQSDRLNKLVGMRIDDLADNICNQNREGGGCRLYTASSSITRLAYLKEAVRIASEIVYAVDRDNRIGLVTFNSSATNQGFFDYANRNSLYSRINNISLSGGTRQDLGLETGKSQLDSNGRPDAQKIAILITDGAPNMRDDKNKQIPSDTAWRMIGEKAAALKGTNSSNAKLYTLGLSLDMVGGNNQRNLNGLASEEDGVTRHFNASNGPDIVKAVKGLIDTLMYDVTLEAEVTDVLDPAFYPVDQNGNPVAAGDYTDDNGKRYNWSVVTVDGAQCWKITYYDQDVGRGEKNADNTIKTPGWQKSFYVKAKEDFLGGNGIKTNRYKSSNNRVKPTKYVYTERGTNTVKKIDPPRNAPWGRFENTPTVNVDELHLTEHSTEWTVYLGTEVKPEDQLWAFWNNIKVKQVVKEGGTANDGTTITESAKKYYDKTDIEDTASPTSGYASLPIGQYFTDTDFEVLLNQLKNVNSAEKTITYPGYGHNPGTITVKLEKTIISGAQDAVGKAPGQHTTDIVGTPVETYKITVTYNPQTDTVSTIGDSVTRSGEDEVKSENVHKINVIKKALKIKKTDMVGTLLTDAVGFTLYRKAVNGDTNTVSLTDVAGLEDGNYVAVVRSTISGYATFDPVYPIKDADGTYKQQTTDFWLVETNSPSNYTAMPGAVKVTLGLTETKTDKPEGQTNTGLYDWMQSVTVSMEAVSDAADFYMAPTSTEAETIEFSIKNDKDTEITVIKVDAMDDTKTLSGAKFKLTRNSQVVTDATITSLASGGGTISLDADNCFELPKEGVKISGLKSGKYTLQEKASPAGYIITEQPLTFKAGNGTITNRSDGETNNAVVFRVPNTPGATLPNTGGPGTRIFTILGNILILGAGMLLWRKRRMINTV